MNGSARNVLVLAAAQAFSASGMMTMTLLGGILGSVLAPAPELAAGAALVISYAIVQSSFTMLCLAALVLGSNLAFQQQHRFVGVSALCLATAAVLTLYRPAPMTHAASAGPSRPLVQIVRQPLYLLAVLAAVTSYAGMSFIMTATPISMHVHDHHSDGATAWVIQSHLLAMYVPSLFSGALIMRVGVRTGMTAGLALMAMFAALLAFGPSPSGRGSRAGGR